MDFPQAESEIKHKKSTARKLTLGMASYTLSHITWMSGAMSITLLKGFHGNLRDKKKVWIKIKRTEVRFIYH
jgi:hypothetical protein